MYSNTKNLSKAVLTAAFGLFLVACNSSSSGGGGTTTPTNPNTTPTNPNTTVPPDMVLDTIAPTITSISGLSSDVRPTSTVGFDVMITFSEPVDGFSPYDASDFTLENLVINSVTANNLANGFASEYTVAVEPESGLAHDDVISLRVNAAAAQDEANNDSAVSTVASTTWVDTTGPVQVGDVVFSDGASDITSYNGTEIALRFTVNFNEPIFQNSEVNITSDNGILFNESASFTGTQLIISMLRTSLLNPTSPITVTIPENAVLDSLSNGNLPIILTTLPYQAL